MTIECYYLKDGRRRWCVTYYEHGRLRTKHGFPTRRDAEQWLRELNASRRPPRPEYEPGPTGSIGPPGLGAFVHEREGRVEILFDATGFMHDLARELEDEEQEKGAQIIQFRRKDQD